MTARLDGTRLDGRQAAPKRRVIGPLSDHEAPPATDEPRPAPPAGPPPVSADQAARATVEAVYRAESRRVFATLIRLLGDFDLAEEALSDAFRAALEQWPRDGVPANPRAWLVSAGRFKAIDGIRRRARFVSVEDVAEQVEAIPDDIPSRDGEDIEDDRLRLVFTCCHPAIAPDAQVALTLREICGLTTEEIAQAFLSTPPTLAQRIVRAKAKIRDARIPYQVPSPAELPERLDSVLRVVYLVFNEGYSASSGGSLTRVDLSSEAIRLGRLLVELLPEPEVIGLLALMLLQEARRAARASPDGELILLADQDRSLWNREQIAEGSALVERALASRRFGPYTLQAAIAAVHADAATADATDWREIVGLYDVLLEAEPSPVIELNRAVAVAMRDGPSAGLALVDAHPRPRRSAGLPPGARGPGGSLPPARRRRGGPGLLRAGARSHPAGTRAAVSRAAAGRVARLADAGGRIRPPRFDQGCPTVSKENAMRFLCLIRAEKVMEQLTPADAAKHFEDYRDFTAAIRESGHFAGANRLLPPETATTVRVRNGKVSTTDGPFAETKEQLGGYYLVESRDRDEAVRIAARIPGAWIGSVEVRPVAEDAETRRVLEPARR